jgi:hypothetical protein
MSRRRASWPGSGGARLLALAPPLVIVVALSLLAGGSLAPGARAASSAPALPPALTLTSAPGAKYPQLSFRLSTSGSLGAAPKASVTENSIAVSGLSVTPATQAGITRFGTVLIIDRSWSMNGAPLDSAIQAARALVSARAPGQPVAVIFLAQTTTLAAPLTSNARLLDAALAKPPRPASGTLIMDAVGRALALAASSARRPSPIG